MIGQPEPQLSDYGHLLVRRAICRGDWVSDAIFELAANGQREWTLAEWKKLESELETSKLRLREWLILYT
jgi:hypothetical protein